MCCQVHHGYAHLPFNDILASYKTRTRLACLANPAHLGVGLVERGLVADEEAVRLRVGLNERERARKGGNVDQEATQWEDWNTTR